MTKKKLLKKLESDIKEPFRKGKKSSTPPVSTTVNQHILYYETEYEDHGIEMYLDRPDNYTVPVEIFEFISDVEDLQSVIKETCKGEDELDKYLIPLFGIAEVGGTSTYNSFAKKRLESFKNNFVRAKWWSLKLPFVKELGLYTFYATLIYLIIMFALKADFMNDAVYDQLNMERSYFLNWFLVLMGTALGTWVSFSLFKKNKTIEELKSLRDNIPHPFYRLALVSMVASVFYLLFITGIFNVEIGGGDLLNTKNIGNIESGNFALLMGVFLGFGELRIGESLRKRIDSYTSKF